MTNENNGIRKTRKYICQSEGLFRDDVRSNSLDDAPSISIEVLLIINGECIDMTNAITKWFKSGQCAPEPSAIPSHVPEPGFVANKYLPEASEIHKPKNRIVIIIEPSASRVSTYCLYGVFHRYLRFIPSVLLIMSFERLLDNQPQHPFQFKQLAI